MKQHQTFHTQALAPVMELPPLIQYPVLLLIFGALSFPFTFLFGSGSLGGDRAPTPPSQPAAGETCVCVCVCVCVCDIIFDRMHLLAWYRPLLICT